MRDEIEYVEYEEEVLPALALGVRRLTDGVRGLKIQLEDMHKQVVKLRDELQRLTQVLETSRSTFDEGQRKLMQQYEETVKYLDNFLGKLESTVKTTVELELRGLSYKLSALTSSFDNLSQDLYAHRLEEKDRLNELLENLKNITTEVYEMKLKINDLATLIYDLGVRMNNLEMKVSNDLTEIKLLLAVSKREQQLKS
ncbi:MAG: hypothetical protein QXJ38_01835 [Thermofilaceae archaeon]